MAAQWSELQALTNKGARVQSLVAKLRFPQASQHSLKKKITSRLTAKL